MAVSVKVGETVLPASVEGRICDREWDGRSSKRITAAMTYALASSLFVDGVSWSIVEQREVPVFAENEDGDAVPTGSTETETVEWDNSAYSMAGDITDHRDGTVTVVMGRPTDLEIALAAALTL